MHAIAVAVLLALAVGTGFGNWHAKQRPGRVESGNQVGTYVDREKETDQAKLRDSGISAAELGSRRVHRGRFVEAIPILSQAIEELELWVRKRPDDSQGEWSLAQAMGDLGDCYLATDQLNDAESCFRKSVSRKLKLISRFPDNHEYWSSIADSYHRLGVLYQRRGDVRNGRQSFYEAIRWKRQRLGVSPESSAARFQLAVVCAACARMLDLTGRSQWRQEAFTVYNKAYDLLAALVTKCPGRSTYFRDYYCLVNDYTGCLCSDEATDEVERVRAHVERHTRQLDTLVLNTSDRVTVRWQVGLLHSTQGRLLRMLGRGDKATRQDRITIERLSKLIEELPEEPADGARRSDWEPVEGQSQLAWQLVFCSFQSERNPVRAETLVRSVMAQRPDDAQLWMTLGAAQYRQGEWKAAVSSLRRSLDRPFAENGISYLFLAMAHWQLGAKEESRRRYQQGVEWTEDNRPRDELLVRLQNEATVLLGKR